MDRSKTKGLSSLCPHSTGCPPRHSRYCQRHVNREKDAECTRTRARRGLGLSTTRPSARPAGRGFRGQIWVAGGGGGAVTCLRESRLLPASLPEPPAGPRCAPPLQSPESGAGTRAVSGSVTPAAAQAHPGGREETLAARPL